MLAEPFPPFKRRTLLAGAAVGAGSIALGTPAHAQGGSDGETYTWSGSTSANGWPILTSAAKTEIEGSGGRTVLLASGAPAAILTYFIRRYLYEVADSFEPGDVVGHRKSRRIAADFESNYLSGTAVELFPLDLPLGATGGLFPPQAAVVEKIIEDLGGVITWGRDLDPVKESHFELNAAPGSPALESVIEKIGGIPHEDESLHISMTERTEITD